MENIKKQTEKLRLVIESAIAKLNIVELSEELTLLQAKSKSSDFWQDNMSAQNTMKKIAELEARTKPWRELTDMISELDQWFNLEEDDLEIIKDLHTQVKKIKEKFEALSGQLKFSGPYDSYNVIMSIYAGAGGVDAQDWAQILLRMYIRWAEKKNFEVTIFDESRGDEAGLKSVSLIIQGAFAYGLLKSENGVHRLVRLSPFNADNLRQTSFAQVEVMPRIEGPSKIEIDDNDLKIDVFRSGGHGGQSVNTTDSAVRITHIPTGLVVTVQNERSQTQNKELALSILYSRLTRLTMEQHQEDIKKLKGPNQSAEWGSQIRSYVLHPYKQVKDLRTNYETSNVDNVLDGDIDGLLDAYLNLYLV